MKGYFIDTDELEGREISDGIKIKVVSGERLMLSYIDVSMQTEMVLHSHPNEQAGIVLEGEVEFTIGSETRTVNPGQSYLIPAYVPHGIKTRTGARFLDIFSPPREDYR